MKHFASLFAALEETTGTNAKVDALTEYFRNAPAKDKVWTIALLSSRRPRRTVSTANLRVWAAERAGIPLWLFEESYSIVGDLAETIALVLPEPTRTSNTSLTGWLEFIEALRGEPEELQKAEIINAWEQLDRSERFLFNKLITGGFRIGVSQKLMTRALALATDIEEDILAHNLMGDWSPLTAEFDTFFSGSNNSASLSKPYPFYLAYALEDGLEGLGELANWQAEWKWDGIRGQLVVRGGQHFLWSRGEELITDRFPEFASAAELLPSGTVIDGEILAWRDGAVMPFQALQTRIGRKTVSKKMLGEFPVTMMAYDLLEHEGQDLRNVALAERRTRLENLVTTAAPHSPLLLSPQLTAADWTGLAEVREKSRELGAEGLMLKRRDSIYGIGRKKGDWWKWKVDPLTVDCVMIYAQQGHGRRANLFTDFTFAVPDANGQLVPFTKAYSGLTDEEFREITQWVKRNTLEKFGPVRSVPPVHVFEIAFEGIQRSTRHKSGIALRFPRMKRWRKDKPVSEINTLDDLFAILG